MCEILFRLEMLGKGRATQNDLQALEGHTSVSFVNNIDLFENGTTAKRLNSIEMEFSQQLFLYFDKFEQFEGQDANFLDFR